jgi:hypothetical protein
MTVLAYSFFDFRDSGGADEQDFPEELFSL